jgi:tetratricopeptide (TPR) repeat protein
MGILGKLFNKTTSSAHDDKISSHVSDPANDPNLIRVFDKYGREFFIPKEEWRTNVLPGALKSNWNNPDQLCEVIIGALNDGFITDVAAAAERLYEFDPNSSRGACVYAIVLLKNDRINDAERVLRSFLEKNGDDGSVLTNLAKVYAARGETEKQEATLWRALTVDPNQDNGLAWYEALARDRSGEEAGLDALRRISQLPGSWRAQIWLARAALKSENLPQAVSYYQASLSNAGRNVPSDLLMQMSGDLGNHGHLAKLLELTEPHYVPEQHGLQVGNNLIKAHIEAGELDAAREILDQLFSLKRPDWKETLTYWDTEIAKSRLASSKVHVSEPLSMMMLSIEGPVWLKPGSPAFKLFSSNIHDRPLITFLGSSATMATPAQEIEQQMPDAPGRLSRALPLFLAERVSFALESQVQTLIPWIAAGGGGFVLSGVAWPDSDALNYVRQFGTRTAYTVVTHLDAQSDPWKVNLRLLRMSDGAGVGTLETSFARSIPGEAVVNFSHDLIELLAEQTIVKGKGISSLYELPGVAHIANYLLRLEQYLAVRCAGMDGVSHNFLHGEREIIDGNLQLCLNCPNNVATRILLAQTLLTMNKIKPDVVKEMIEKVAMLQKDKPLTEPAQSVIQEMVRAVYLIPENP